MKNSTYRTSVKEATQFAFNVLKPKDTSPDRASNYLKYPWPSPSPRLPDQLPPRVMNVPKSEVKEFLDKVVSRYKKTIAYKWPKAAAYAFLHRDLEYVSDSEFEEFMNFSSLSQLLTNQFDQADYLAFSDYDIHPSTWRKADFTNVKVIEAIPNCYCTPSIVLFQKDAEGVYRLKAIDLEGEIFTKEDASWPLVKTFALQGAAIHISTFQHSLVHFPMDAVNAISKSVLPSEHIISKLLMPHFYMQLPLDFAVNFVNKSVLHNEQKNIFTPFVHTRDSIFKFLGIAYSGKEEKKCFPAYQFQMQAPDWDSEYGEITREMSKVIYQFVSKVVEKIEDKDKHIIRWANNIAEHLRGFPNGAEIFENDNLARTLTKIILNVSWIHSTDHCSYSALSLTKIPLRLRVPAPKKNQTIDLNRKALFFEDIFRQYMFNEMYNKLSVLKPLIEVEYNFGESDLEQERTIFIQNIRAIYTQTNAAHYIPIHEIATSIQS